MKSMILHLTDELNEALKRYAFRERISLVHAVIQILEGYLGKEIVAEKAESADFDLRRRAGSEREAHK